MLINNIVDEYIDILTSRGSFSGKTRLKSEAHAQGLWHASTQVWIVNIQNKVLLQQRSANKDSYPNLWDISVAGHLSAGDNPISAALREIKEEIGLELEASQLQFFKRIKRSKIPKPNFLDNEFNYLYGVKTDFRLSSLKLQEEEVQAVQLLSLQEFKHQLQQNPSIFVPHGNAYYIYIINKLLLL